jgi:hypothetical protein
MKFINSLMVVVEEGRDCLLATSLSRTGSQSKALRIEELV